MKHELLSDIIDEQQKLTDYGSWKRFEKVCINKLDENLIKLSEDQLTSFFKHSEDSMNSYLRKGEKTQHYMGYLFLSILCHYKRSFAFNQKHFPSVNAGLNDSDRNICKICLYILKKICKKSKESSIFVRKTLHSINTFFETSNVDIIPYNILIVLNHAGKYLPNDVRNMISGYFDPLFRSMASSDREISILAGKLVQVFANKYPKNKMEKPNELYARVKELLTSSINQIMIGELMLLESLYRMDPYSFDLHSILDLLCNCLKCGNSDFFASIIEFIIAVLENNIKLVTENYITRILSGVMELVTTVSVDKIIFDYISKLISLVDLPSNIRDLYLETVIHVISDPSKIKLVNSAYKTLLNLVVKYPDTNITLRHLTFICKHSIPIIKKKIEIMNELDGSGKLFQLYRSGITETEKTKEIVLALRVASLFPAQLSKIQVYNDAKRFICNRDEKVRKACIELLLEINTEDSLKDILNISIYDPSKHVRRKAVKVLFECYHCITDDCITHLLGDSSFKVRREAVPLIAKLIDQNLVLCIHIVHQYVNSFLSNNVASGNIKRVVKACSLLPLLAQYFVPSNTSIAPSMTYVCLHILNDGVFSDPKGLTDIRSHVIVDLVMPYGKYDNGTNSLYSILNQKNIEKRNMYLIQTLLFLVDYVFDSSPQVFGTMLGILSDDYSESIYIQALDVLYKIILNENNQVNYVKLFPNLVPCLKKILSKCLPKVSSKAFSIIGILGVTYMQDTRNTKEINDYIDTSSSSFCVSFILKSIFNIVVEPTKSVFDSILLVFINETQYAVQYLEKFVLYLVSNFKFHEYEVSYMFNTLEILTIHTGRKIIHALPIFEQFIHENLDKNSCLQLVLRLSLTLKQEFTKTMAKIFPVVARIISSGNNENIQVHLQLLAFAVLYQNQSFGQMLDCIDHQMFTRDVNILMIIFQTINMVIQNVNAVQYTPKIVRICFVAIEKHNINELHQLIYNLVLGCNPLGATLKSWLDNLGVSIPYFDVILEKISQDNHKAYDFDFVVKLLPHLDNTHLKYPVMIESSEKIFEDIQTPLYTDQYQWIEEICMKATANSPSRAIRAVYQILEESTLLKQVIYPIAFVSCWVNTKTEERTRFSNILSQFFKSSVQCDQRIIDFVYEVYRAGNTFILSDLELASMCQNASRRLYFSQLHYSITKNTDTHLSLIYLNARMGRIDSARGILEDSKDIIEDRGRIMMDLGDWEKAYKHYSSDGSNNENIIKCYGNLEMWDKIRQNECIFDKVENKGEIAIYYSWAFYYSNELDKIQKYLKYLPKFDLKSIVFKGFYSLISEKYEETQKYINEGIYIISSFNDIYNEYEEKMEYDCLASVLHLVDLKHVLDVKRGSKSSVSKFWEVNLCNISLMSQDWMTLMEIRSMILPPHQNIQSYVKVLSALRKERKWRLCDSLSKRFFEGGVSLLIFIEQLKILWSRSEKDKAIALIGATNRLIDSKNNNEARLALNSIPEYKEILIRKFQLSDNENLIHSIDNYFSSNKMNDRLRSKLLRMQGSWEYSRFNSRRGKADDIMNIYNMLFRSNKLMDTSYKSWTEMASVSYRAIRYFPCDKNHYIKLSISSFLKATKLKPNDSLGHLFRLFSIILRYGSGDILTKEIMADIFGLPPSLIYAVIHQIAGHINHKNAAVRNMIQRLIVAFGDNYFEGVVYPLSLLTTIEEKSLEANNLLLRMGRNHKDKFRESKLLIDGLRNAAVTLMDIWMDALQRALVLFSQGEVDEYMRKMDDLFNKTEQANNEANELFKTHYLGQMETVKNNYNLFLKNRNLSTNALFSSMQNFQSEIESRLNNINFISLKRILPELADYKKFSLSIPGRYNIEGKYPLLLSVDPNLPILKTQKHPRCIFMTDHDGGGWKFLLKGNEDLRLDQRIMNFFILLNNLMKNDKTTSNMGEYLSKYTIIPLSHNSGLISWVLGADTLQQLIFEFRNSRKIAENTERAIIFEFTGLKNYDKSNYLQKYEIIKEITDKTPANELKESIWVRSPNSNIWMTRTRTYTISTATASIAGYIIGLGDRHPSNIMIRRHTGSVIHIDFGDSFETAINRTHLPERVPFRLTRMIVNALDSSSVNGLFRRICEDVLWVLRENQNAILSQLEVFVYEPIFESHRSGNKTPEETIRKVSQKLSGTEFSDKPINVKDQVDMLIRKASDLQEYCQHYSGWCPFW